MKKVTSILLALALLLTAGACGKDSKEEGTSASASSSASQSQEDGATSASSGQETDGGGEEEGWNAGNGLQVISLDSYSGLFVEDGSDETVSDICGIRVKNMAEETVQYAHLTMTTGEVTYEFDLSTLPPAREVQLLDLNRQAPPESTDNLSLAVSEYAAFSEEPSMNEDVLEITAQDTAITITNRSDQDMSQVYVYYKLDYGDFYLGGITYRVGASDLAAGESTTCYAGHYTSDECSLMFTTYVY